MRYWVTQITAIDPFTGKLEKWKGEDIRAPSFELAVEWCRLNKSYLEVLGEHMHTMDVLPDEIIEPNWERVQDDTKANLN